MCEILACEKNFTRAHELLDLLYELNLWRGNRRLTGSIIEGLGHLSLMTGLNSPRLAGKVAETLWKVCWHFVGPDKVSMSKADLVLVLECVDSLGTLAEFNCMMGRGRDAAVAIAEQLTNYFYVGLWYRKKRIVNAVVKACESGVHECFDKDRVDFAPGLRSLRSSLRRMHRALAKERPGWREQRRRLEQLLAGVPHSTRFS